jgi:hypothetical protein
MFSSSICFTRYISQTSYSQFSILEREALDHGGQIRNGNYLSRRNPSDRLPPSGVKLSDQQDYWITDPARIKQEKLKAKPESRV